MGNSVKTAFIIIFIVWASSLYVSKSGKGIEIVPNFCRLIIMAITKQNNLNLPFSMFTFGMKSALFCLLHDETLYLLNTQRTLFFIIFLVPISAITNSLAELAIFKHNQSM